MYILAYIPSGMFIASFDIEIRSVESKDFRTCFHEFIFYRNHEIWPRDAVSAFEFHGSEAIFLCWRTMPIVVTRRASSVWA